MLGRGADVLRGSDELGVRIAHLVLAQTPTPVLVDEMLAGEAMVDLAAGLCAPEHPDRHRHLEQGSPAAQ
jgi:hypothetical protein